MADEELQGTPAPDANASQETEPEPTQPEGEEAGKAEETGSEAESSPAADPSEKKEPKGFMKRIDKLTYQREEEKRLREAAERDRDFWRQQAEKPKEQGPSKTLADFDHNEAAYQAYVIEQASLRAAEATRQEMAKFGQEESEQRQAAMYTAREAEFAEGVPDYHESVRSAWECSKPMADAIRGSEFGPAIAYRLSKNPAIASHIAQLNPFNAAREIGRIEGQILAERMTPPAKVSKAPPPAAKIAPTDPGAEKDPANMTDAEFAKWRRKQIAQRS